MTNILGDGDVLYAIVDHIMSEQEYGTTKWYGDKLHAIQAARFKYDMGKKFAGHRHIERIRSTNITQEAMIVVSGCLRAKIYDEKKQFIGQYDLTQGSIIVIYRGYHEYEIMDQNTIFFEVKNGPFTSVESDKEYL